MQRYYCRDWKKEEIFFLSEEESFHCHSVMRNELGRKIAVLDGIGNEISAEIVNPSPKKLGLKFIELIRREDKPNQLHIGISPTKSNDRIEWFIEKACEIGIGRITPIEFQRTERNKINQDRWEKLIISACKQSGLLWFPVLDELIKWKKFLSTHDVNELSIASIRSHKPMNQSNLINRIIIGPEGDFSEEEMEEIRIRAIDQISLSENILRVETAGVTAVAQWNFLNNYLSL